MSDVSIIPSELPTLFDSLAANKTLIPFVSFRPVCDESSDVAQSDAFTTLQTVYVPALVLRNPPYASMLPRIAHVLLTTRLHICERFLLERKISQQIFRQYEQPVQCIFGFWRWLEQVHPKSTVITLNQLQTAEYLQQEGDQMNKLHQPSKCVLISYLTLSFHFGMQNQCEYQFICISTASLRKWVTIKSFQHSRPTMNCNVSLHLSFFRSAMHSRGLVTNVSNLSQT
jgi:hypothetical protein